MKIERVTRYRVDGKEFETVEKAKDFIDGKVNSLLQNGILALPNNMIGIREISAITDIVLGNREYLAYLLSIELPEDEE